MPKRKTTKEFIDEANIVHKGKYIYNKTKYIKSNLKVCITCPIHGDFYQTPSNHLSGHGCPKCMVDLLHKLKLTNEDVYFSKCNTVHNDKYIYTESKYNGEYNPIDIICPIHGKFTLRNAKSHLLGYGCPVCGREKIKMCRLKNTENFISDAKKVHKDRYIYDKANYTGAFDLVEIICPKHGSFWQRAYCHLNGNGCPKCRYSTLERIISNELVKRNIKFEYEKKFDFLPPLSSIDFYLPDYNAAIECQGIQHFISCSFFGGEKSFQKVFENDLRKIKGCDKLGIRLFHFTNVEIPNDFNSYHVYTDIDELFNEITKS